MSIKSPEDIEGKSIKELQTLNRELSFQLRIVNHALKDHTREAKFRKFFEEYPYYIDNNKAVEIDIKHVLSLDKSGFGYGNLGLPKWGESYGMGDKEFHCLKDPSELQTRLKILDIYDNMIELTSNQKENITQKQERIGKILKGFDLNA